MREREREREIERYLVGTALEFDRDRDSHHSKRTDEGFPVYGPLPIPYEEPSSTTRTNIKHNYTGNNVL